MCFKFSERNERQLMDWHRTEISVYSSTEFIGANPVQRGTWISLLGWCTAQENGGVIANCRGWGDRRWMQTCGVTVDEVASECDLWEWDGDDLLVSFYPEADEKQCQARRKRGKIAGKKSAEVRKDKSGSTKNELESNNGATNAELNVNNGATKSGESDNLVQLECEKHKSSSTKSAKSDVLVPTEERRGEERRREGEERKACSTKIEQPDNRIALAHLKILCHVGPGEDESFGLLAETYTKDFLTTAINARRESRKRNGEKPRPCMSDLSEWIRLHGDKHPDRHHRKEAS